MGNGPREPLDQLLDREVDDRDAGRRRAPRWRDRQPGRSLRAYAAAAARLGLRGRHHPQCPADVLGRGLARGRGRRRPLRGLSPGPGHGEPAAGRHPGPDVQAAARPSAGHRLQLLDRRELRARPRWSRPPWAGRWPTTSPRRVWGPAGMEADAYWQLESDDGLELGGLGVSARLRDVGRFGQLVLEDGEALGGRRVLPPGWRDLAGRPDCAATAFGRLHARRSRRIRLPVVGDAARADRHPRRRLRRRSAPTASSSTSIRASRWSWRSRARGVSPMTATPPSRPSRCSGRGARAPARPGAVTQAWRPSGWPAYGRSCPRGYGVPTISASGKPGRKLAVHALWLTARDFGLAMRRDVERRGIEA